MDWELIQKLMSCFRDSFINQCGEFIAHREANEYFILKNCKDELDVKCKVLEWFSRSAHKGCPYRSERRNVQFQDFMLNGINEFLGTNFAKNDMEQIYIFLGNACNREKTIRFILGNYDMSLLN